MNERVHFIFWNFMVVTYGGLVVPRLDPVLIITA
jgi:hypothetical protein